MKEPDYKEIQKLYNEYYFALSPKDLSLAEQIDEYEKKYFEDMTLLPHSVASEFIVYQIQWENGECHDESEDYECNLDANYYRFYVEKLEDGVAGCNYPLEHKIVIDPNCSENQAVILHEMIHAYETIISQNFLTYIHDILLISLYKSLKEKIPDLDDRMLNHTHQLSQEQISRAGGPHDLLFFLKSLDLDLRCDYKLGTVCGYGRNEYGDNAN